MIDLWVLGVLITHWLFKKVLIDRFMGFGSLNHALVV